jgi:geranylgeranylglycerol-phosphate geranylgeranyltransferase
VGIPRALVKTVRPPSSLLAFLSVLLPFMTRTNDLSGSLQKALPFLFGSMCTFIVNALDDVEKDAINHPERPLPSGELKPALVTVVYFCCLAAALLSIRFGVGTHPISFFYYGLLVMAISYSYVVEYLPGLKPLYVALASTGPVIVLAQYYPRETALYPVALAGFFFVLGRELCKDLPDRPGDPVSILHTLEPRQVAVVSGGCQVAGIVLLSLQARTAAEWLDLLLMGTLIVLAYVSWLRRSRLATALGMMKGVIFLGLFFLL